RNSRQLRAGQSTCVNVHAFTKTRLWISRHLAGDNTWTQCPFERINVTMSLVTAETARRAWWHQNEFGPKAIGSLKAGVAAVLSVGLADLLGLTHAYWAAVSAMVVMGWEDTLTFASCRDRILGTAIGALMGWATFYIWHGHYLLYGVSAALCIFAC